MGHVEQSQSGRFKHPNIYSNIFSQIQAQLGIFRTYLEPSVTLTYSGPRNIQDRGIFRILSNIYDGVFYKIVNDYNYFGKL